ncbi:exonuclease domain-containing protein [Sulfurimonas sp. ST-25]|uniref:3'-5' exonuclease n=1 Tax=Sulfurimonas sp. ST-25 TaxID=3400151 RepID=UPI003A84EE1F
MKKKLLYIDTETTGLDPQRHGLREIACILVEDGEVVDIFKTMVNPGTYRREVEIDQQALDISGKDREELKLYPSSDEAMEAFRGFLSRHKPEDGRLQIAGYNVGFDIGFLKEWFKDCELNYDDFFNYKPLDIFALVGVLRYHGHINTKSDKLAVVCEAFSIPIDAHNALSDITATMQLHQLLADRFICEKEIAQ